MEMEIINIYSIEEFVSKIEFLEETDVFRGQSSVNYRLLPSVGRIPFEKPAEHLEQYEKSIFEDFKRKAPIFLRQNPDNDLDWLILAQHYGLPTRLLDWTYNPLIAFYFAIENETQADSCIYQGMLSQILKSDMLKNRNPFEIRASLGIIPVMNNNRCHSQNGLFTINPTPYKEDKSFVFKKYVIPLSSKKFMRWKLRKLGITKALIFPQLDSIAHDIVQIHKSKYEHAFKK